MKEGMCERKLNMRYIPQNQNTLSTRNSETHSPTTPQQIQLHIRAKTILSNCFLCLYITGINEFLSRINTFTFRPPLSSGNIGTFKDCLLLEQGRDDLLFSLFLSLSTCMHADASNLTSSVSKRKQIKITFGLFCFPKLQPMHWHFPCKSHISSNWYTAQTQSRWTPKPSFLLDLFSHVFSPQCGLQSYNLSKGIYQYK